jgi:Spherulation-specific family 4
MSGIFFDETTAIYNSDTLAYMTNITEYARSVLGPGNDTIVFNPGTIAPTQWYSLADHVVAYEDTYADYSSNVIASIPAALRPQSSFIMYSFTGDAPTQQTLIDSIVAAGVSGLFITTVPGYTAWSALMGQFCSAMDLT